MAAFLASAISFVFSNTFPYSSLYSLCNPSFNSGDKESKVELTISFTIPLDADTISSAPSNIPLKLSLTVKDFISVNVFLSVFFILLVALELSADCAAPLAKTTSLPISLNACVSI